MWRARITEPGVVRWSEKCFCQPPLKHECDTVYGKYFTDMEVKAADGYVEFEGDGFVEFLEGNEGIRIRLIAEFHQQLVTAAIDQHSIWLVAESRAAVGRPDCSDGWCAILVNV